VASIVHYIFRRGFHGGLLSLAGCFIQAFRVPIVPVDDLCDFFKSDEVSYLRYERGLRVECACR